MKTAVIATGGKQYVVTEGEELRVELLEEGVNSFDVLLTSDGKSTKVGSPTVKGSKVTFSILESDIQDDKVTAIRFKAKKRVKKVHGHRQHKSLIKITAIS